MLKRSIIVLVVVAGICGCDYQTSESRENRLARAAFYSGWMKGTLFSMKHGCNFTNEQMEAFFTKDSLEIEAILNK